MAAVCKSINASDHFEFGPWSIVSEHSHILPSKCSTPNNCLSKKTSTTTEINLCNFCRYEQDLLLPKLPDMTFAGNYLTLTHSGGFGITYRCLDALNEVDNPRKLMKVAVADAWNESREESEHVKEVVKPFDWTFTTSYKGTLFGGQHLFTILPTNERIDMEKLKVKEEIMFYGDTCLFEDELADNGIAQCSVKIRVMKSGFFVLLRYFLRVDNVLARMHDTRIYYETGKDFMLREYCTRESKLTDLMVSNAVLTNPAELSQHLDVKELQTEILKFPDIACNNESLS